MTGMRLTPEECPACGADSRFCCLYAYDHRADARLAAALSVLDDEPMFVSGIRRSIQKNTDGYGRGGDITHTPRPGRRGSGSCPGDNLTRWLDDLRAALRPDPSEAVVQQYPAGHGFTPGKFSGGCRVMLARYPCNYAPDEHDPDRPPEDLDHFGYRRGRFATPLTRAREAPMPDATHGAEDDAGSLCPDCGHQHTPYGCEGDPTSSDLWAGVSVAGCDCIPIDDLRHSDIPPGSSDPSDPT